MSYTVERHNGCTHIEAREEGLVENIASFNLSQCLRASDLFSTLQDDFFFSLNLGCANVKFKETKFR